MNKHIVSWAIVLFISIGLVFIIRIFFIRIQTVPDNSMNNALFIDDRVICMKFRQIEHESVVLVKWNSENKKSFKRIIGQPFDTLLIRHSVLYINGKRNPDKPGVTFLYRFSTDSISYAKSLLSKNNIEFDAQLSSIGVFQFEASLDDLKHIKNDSILFKVKRVISEPTVALIESRKFSNYAYWNKDNIGPLIIPGKGSRIRITSKNFQFYRQIIEKESGKKLDLINNQLYLSKSPIDYFAFGQNYYFVLNDNRQDIEDSRTKGFISENEVYAKFWFKLPW
jgi:signal peptidase I